MGERTTMSAATGPGTKQPNEPPCELCAATADIRRRIAAGVPESLASLQTRLGSILERLSHVDLASRSRAPLLALLDEVSGLVGQLELERAEARARVAAFDHHRRAERRYTVVREDR